MKKIKISLWAGFLFGAMNSMAQACPDPAITSLQIKQADMQTDGSWKLEVTGTVRNQGNADFVSTPDQQSISLSINRYGPRGVVTSTVLKEKLPVRNGQSYLPAGSVHIVNYRGTLNALKGENARPRLKLAIIYDPAIYNDDSSLNDDCHSDNNENMVTL
ncbi:MAG: hypothetical protein R3F02_01115 [Thiolinea sp.]